MAFEYVSQLLVDNNSAILILKMLSTWFQVGEGSSRAEEKRIGVPAFSGMANAWLRAREEMPELK